jgi:hypothetical protein
MEPLFLLCLVIGVGLSGYLAQRRRLDRRPLLNPGRGARRGGLQARDVLQHLGNDYLIESVIRLEEASQVRLLCRLRGPGRTHLWVPGGDDPGEAFWLLCEQPPLLEPPAEVIAHGGLRYRLARRFRVEATYLLSGGQAEPLLLQSALEYRGLGAARLLLLSRGEGEPVLLLSGEALPRHMVDILPGSGT